MAIQIKQFSLVIMNDDAHTVQYVIDILLRICRTDRRTAERLAEEINRQGMAVVWTGSREVGELKMEQILNAGPDPHGDPNFVVCFPLECYLQPL